MKTEQFQKLLTEYAEQTSNVRALSTKWFSGVNRVPDEIASKIGSIVSLLQARVEEGCFCKKDEYLLIYNFQPLQTSEEAYLCSLDMVIKPISELGDVSICKGKPLQLVVNGTTGTVGNNSYGMVTMGLISAKEAEADEDAPIIYGSYKEYSEPKQREISRGLSIITLQTINFTSKKVEIKVKQEDIKIKRKPAALSEDLDITVGAGVYFAFQQKAAATFEEDSPHLTSDRSSSFGRLVLSPTIAKARKI